MAGSTISWTAPNGTVVSLSPSLIQAAQIGATIPANLLSSAGTAQIAVADPSLALSNSVPFTIGTPPGISSVTPNSVVSGSPATAISIAGQNFASNSAIRWTDVNGNVTTLAPSLVQAAQIAATLPASFLTTSGTAQVQITDASGALSNRVPFTISQPALTIQTTALLPGWLNTAYPAFSMKAAGGTGTLTWSVLGSLPGGLALAPQSGVLSGTPNAAGIFSFTIQVADSGSPQQVKSQSYTLQVSQQYVISTIAGGVGPPLPAPALSVTFGLNTPGGLAAGPSGSTYFAWLDSIFKVDPGGP